MNSTAWQRAKQIFHEALEKSDSERAGFVALACGDDRDLRLQVEALLSAHDEAGEFLASPTVPEADAATRAATTLIESPPTERPGAMIGHYKLLQVIGEGGFGVVYMAEQEEPVRRRVALKIIKLGMDTKQVIARFEAERQALALMEHANIARVLDAGATETGRPYFVMELVKGVPITEYCDSNRLTTRERLDLFTEICSAVQHAHQKGIVHRDIKPSNVLVTLHDGTPVPKVIDFGIAKATSQRLTEKTLFTAYGQFIGTPLYMSPEQAEMSGLDVDTRSDIYSLGVLLYELLTGTTPFDVESLREAGFAEMQRIIREEEPPKPSTRLSTLGGALTDIAKHRKSDPNGLSRLVRGDLDWIVMKALEKDRTRRYASASEFAADVARHLGDELVIARPPTAAYKIRKFVTKHKGPVAAVSAVILTALVLGSVAFWQGRVAQYQAMRVRAHSILAAADVTEDPLLKTLLVNEVADVPDLPRRLRIAREAADYPLPLLVFRGHESALRTMAFSPDGDRLLTVPEFGPARIWRTDGSGQPVVLRQPGVGLWDAAFSPSGDRVVTASYDGNARIWRADGTGEPLVLAGHENWVRSAMFSPDGKSVLTAANDGTARVWRADGTGQPVVLRGHEDAVLSGAVYSPDGTRVATASGATVRIWRADGTGEPVVLRNGGGVYRVAFSPDGQRLVTTGKVGGKVRVWSVTGADDPIVLPVEQAWNVSFSPDGALIVTGAEDRTARVWHADGTGEPVVQRHEEHVWDAVFSPDGSLVATASGAEARVWRADGKGNPIVLGRHEGDVIKVLFSPDGTRVATASQDGTARLWRSDRCGETILLRGEENYLDGAAFSLDGTRVITSGERTVQVWRPGEPGEPVILEGVRGSLSPDGTRAVTIVKRTVARVWRADGKGEPIDLEGHEKLIWQAAFSPDGNKVATASEDGTVRIWRADGSGQPLVLKGHDAGVIRVAFTPDGTRVVGACIDGSVRIWHADGTGSPVTLPGPESVLRSIYRVYDRDDSLVRRLNAYWDETGRVWREESTQEPVVVPEGGRGHIYQAYWVPEVALSPDGTLVLVVNTGTVWRVDGTGEPVVLPSHRDVLMNAAFSPDGQRIAAGGYDGAVRVWRVDGTAEPIVLRGHANQVYHVAFSPDGTRIVSGSVDQTARVWNADGSGEPLVLRGHWGAPFRVSFSPDGTRVLIASWGGTASIWRVTWPELLAHLRENLNACLSPAQRMKFLAESSSGAWKPYDKCERAQGREPVLR